MSYEIIHTACEDNFSITFRSGKNVANPTASLLSAVKMLKHVGLKDHAWILDHAVEDVLAKQKVSNRPAK